MTVITWVLLIVLVLLSVYPTVLLLTGAFRTGSPFFGESDWSLEGWQTAFGTSVSQNAIGNSIVLALIVAVFGTGIGFLFAWTGARTNVPLRRYLTAIMVVTVALPSLFNAMSWAVLANERSGLINQLWRLVFGPEATLVNVYSWPGLVAISLIKPIAIAYLLLLGPCRGLNRSIEEASVLAGTSVIRTMARITAPVLAPTILAVFIINLIIGLESFDIPALIAVPARIPVLSTEVYRYIHESIPSDYGAASALALAITVVVMVLVWIRWRLVAKHSYTTVTGKSSGHAVWGLGRWAPFFTAAIIIYTALALVLPLVQLVAGSFQPIFGRWDLLGVANYDSVFRNPQTIAAIGRSLMVGIGGGLLAMLFTLAVGYVVRHAGRRASVRVLDLATWLPAALPGIVLGLALSWTYLSVPVLRQLYGTPVMLVLALMVAAMPLAARASEGGLVQIHRELEEAARVSGARPATTVANVLVPLITPSFLAGWLLTSLYVAGKLDVPILLSTSGNRLAIVVVYELYTNGRTGEAAAVFCLLLAGFVIVTALMAGCGYLASRLLSRGRAQAELTRLDDASTADTYTLLTAQSRKGRSHG